MNSKKEKDCKDLLLLLLSFQRLKNAMVMDVDAQHTTTTYKEVARQNEME